MSRRAGGAGRGLLASPASPERGAVTAETAVVLPVLIAVAMGLTWLISIGVTKVRVVDAARETARAVAREEPRAQAIQLGGRIAPEHSRFSVVNQGKTVRVLVTADVPGPGGLFRFLPVVQVDAEAVTATEVP